MVHIKKKNQKKKVYKIIQNIEYESPLYNS